MIGRAVLPVATVALLPGLAVGQQAFDGVWCAEDNGEVMFLDGGSLGFNEHTLCETDTAIALGLASPWSGVAACRNVYVLDRKADGSFETHEQAGPTLDLRIAARGIDRVAVSFDQKPPKPYARCGE